VRVSHEEIRSRLYTAVLSDVLDDLGCPDQAMRPFVRPLDDTLNLFGRVRTGLYMPVYEVKPDHNPYEIEMALVDDLQDGDVALFACDGPTDRIAPWGELLSTRAQYLKSGGCVTDGLVRDVKAIREMGFPVFAGGIGPLDSKGRGEMVAKDVPVMCGGVHARTGDFIFGDVDGVVVLPEAVAEAAIDAALEKVAAEDKTRDALRDGEALSAVFARFGVL
jgi:regulator of RNase E activity RraA